MESLRSRVRPGSPGGPVLVLLHGLGADENDLYSLTPWIPAEWTVVAFRAPRQNPFGGYAWFDVRFRNDGFDRDAAQALASRDQLVAELDRFSDRELYLGGFSQGAAMTYGVIGSRPKLVRGALLLSGFPIPEFTLGALEGLPCLVQHGKEDPLVPISWGQAAAEKLSAAGANVVWQTFPFAHQITPESWRDAMTWLSKQRTPVA